MTEILKLPAPLLWAACLTALGALGLLAAWLTPRLRARRDAARVRYQLGPAQRHLPLPDQVVTLAGALACPEGTCARFQDGTPAAAATMWGVSLRPRQAGEAPAGPLRARTRADAADRRGPGDPDRTAGRGGGSRGVRPGRNFNALDETIQRRTAAALDTPPAFHLDRVFCFRSVEPGTPVMVRGYLQLQAEQGDHEASYRQPAERWVLSPVSTAPGVDEGAPDVLELAAERVPAVQGPQWQRLLRGAWLGLAAGALLAGGVTLRPSASGRAQGPAAASSGGPAPVVWQAAAALGERLEARPPATRRLVQLFQQVVDACALDAAGNVRSSLQLPRRGAGARPPGARGGRGGGAADLLRPGRPRHLPYPRAGQQPHRPAGHALRHRGRLHRPGRQQRGAALPDPAPPRGAQARPGPAAGPGAGLRRHRAAPPPRGRDRPGRPPSVSVRAAGYSALWTRGRLRVLPALQRLVTGRGEPYWVKAAALRGFNGGGLPLQEDEVEPVCGLLERLMVRDDLHLAATAAQQVASTCHRPGRVLTAASDLIDRDHFNGDYVGVLWQLSSSTTVTPDLRHRAAALLRRVVRSPRATDKTREKARRALASRVIVLR